jgi:hypothetical protein
MRDALRFRAAVAVTSMAFASALSVEAALGSSLPPGYWDLSESQPILDKTLTIRLAPDLSALSPSESLAVRRLVEAGEIFQRIYETSLHYQALAAREKLAALDRRLASPPATQNLLTLYGLFQGPIATTLDNERVPFLPVDSIVPGRNVYPWGATKTEIEGFLASRPDARPYLLDERTVVRRVDTTMLRRDIETFRSHPAFDALLPGVRSRLAALHVRGDARAAFYAAPYAVAYAEDLLRASSLLNEAAGAVETGDPDFAAYLRLRARDLLANDYEAGDAAWVTGDFTRLNAQIGAYETYDDGLFGAKAFFGASVLVRDDRLTEDVRKAIRGIQALENSLPYDAHKRVREDIPVGVYNVIADFGQTRGTNTATILPNDVRHARKYGRTILMRYNIVTHADLVSAQRETWRTAVEERFVGDFAVEGNFHRILWHEIGHYLGVDRTKDGRRLDAALEEDADTLEEMKADLVSLYLATELRKSGYYDAKDVRGLYASGVGRVLLKNKPRRDQPYQTMQLMQMNFYLEKGLLRFDRATGRLAIDYDLYHEVVGALLGEVLRMQRNGDKAAADRFIDNYTTWDEALHEVVARRMRDAETSRFRLVRYAALGE